MRLDLCKKVGEDGGSAGVYRSAQACQKFLERAIRYGTAHQRCRSSSARRGASSQTAFDWIAENAPHARAIIYEPDFFAPISLPIRGADMADADARRPHDTWAGPEGKAVT